MIEKIPSGYGPLYVVDATKGQSYRQQRHEAEVCQTQSQGPTGFGRKHWSFVNRMKTYYKSIFLFCFVGGSAYFV